MASPVRVRFVWAILLASAAATAVDQAKGQAEVPPDVVVPVLVRDPGVRKELGLTTESEQALDRLLDGWNERLFRLRMLTPGTDDEQIAATLTGFGDGLRQILDAEQQVRLNGLKLQANGWRSLKDPAVAADLRLTDSQHKKIAAALEQTVRAAQKLQEASSKGGSDADLEGELRKLRMAEQERIVTILTEPQKRKWLDLVGPQYDLTTVRQSAGQAPELQGITEWVNSPPQTLADLRGRVVVLHFIAADCVNCIRNLPHYQSWHERFADRDVTVLGIHSPETTAERDANHVREQFKRYGLTYPVALDAEMKTWDAWTNRMWPSTYLIDKRGEVRFWWYGELQWQGAEGERIMRERIELLLAEE